MTQHIDPVCGMTVDPARAAGSSEYGGQTIYFCSKGCKTKFDADPAKYMGPSKPVETKSMSGEWTCPMHPEVVRDAPGSCPICGMALEPRAVQIEEDTTELKDMSRRFWLSALLTAPLVAFAMLRHLPAGHDLLSPALMARGSWIELALATPVVLWGGWPFFQRAWASIVNRHLNMFTLIG